MPEMIMYLTARDAERIRVWVNAERSLVWIVKHAQSGCDYFWKAAREIGELSVQEYCLWQVNSSRLSIPSGAPGVPDTPVEDPFAGWWQRLPNAQATVPWFGGNLPGPYFFHFIEHGRKPPGSIGRSGLFWNGDRFREIGKPASEEAKLGWKRIQNFVKRSSVTIPWPPGCVDSSRRAYAFEDAYVAICAGADVDANP